MYESHYGMSRRPFRETVCDSAYLPLPSRAAVLRRLKYGMLQADGPALLFGPVGSGKTIAARKLAADLGGPVALLGFPVMPAVDFVSYVADELEDSAPGRSRGASMLAAMRRLESVLEACSARGERPLLVLDEAQSIADPAVFDVVRMLLNYASRGTPDLRILLVGSTDVLLRLPPALSDRLSARCLLGPLTESETAEYLAGRLAAAGAAAELFTADAVAALHRAADGLPRRINRLADLALLIAYAEESTRCEPRTVHIASQELGYDQAA